MLSYKIEVSSDLEYLYFCHNDLFLIVVLSKSRYYDGDFNLISCSEYSANSKTSLVYNLDETDKTIAKVGEMDEDKECCYKKSIQVINSAIQQNREINEKILHSENIPLLKYKDFKLLHLTRMIRFNMIDSSSSMQYKIYVLDDPDGMKRFVVDGCLRIFTALNDDDVLKQVYSMKKDGLLSDQKWTNKEIRKLFGYPTIEQMY